MGKTLLISEIEVQKYLPMEEIIDSVEKLQEFFTSEIADGSVGGTFHIYTNTACGLPALYLLRRFPVKRIRRPGFSDSILYMQFIQKFCKHLHALLVYFDLIGWRRIMIICSFGFEFFKICSQLTPLFLMTYFKILQYVVNQRHRGQ